MLILLTGKAEPRTSPTLQVLFMWVMFANISLAKISHMTEAGWRITFCASRLNSKGGHNKGEELELLSILPWDRGGFPARGRVFFYKVSLLSGSMTVT